MKVIISNVAQCLKTLVCSVLRLTQTDSNFCLLSRHSSCFMGTCCFICSSLSVVLGEKHCRPTVSPLKRKLGGKKRLLDGAIIFTDMKTARKHL